MVDLDELSNEQVIGYSLVVVIFVATVLFGVGNLAASVGDSPSATNTPTPAPTSTPSEITTDTPTKTQTETQTVTPSPSPTTRPVQYLDLFEREIRAIGDFGISHLSEGPGAVYLDHRMAVVTAERVENDIGVVAVAYADVVSRGWGVPRVEGAIVDEDDFPIGFYYIERSWAADYSSGDISIEEYSELVLGTLEANN